MKYQGKITDPKDLVTKEYVDTGLSGKQTKITASGVLIGNGSGGVTAKTLDTSGLTNDNNHVPTSGVVKSALESQVVANPTLAGTEADLTALQVGWTKYKVPSGGGGTPYDSNPAMDGTASPGSSTAYSRGDHVHPADVTSFYSPNYPTGAIADEEGNILGVLSPANPLSGKKFSILGDSISTYSGYLPSGYETYYPRGDLNSVDKTWWKKLIAYSGMSLLQNASWSGSTVSGDTSTTTGRIGCSDARINALKNGTILPDIIFCYISTNDWSSGVPAGSFDSKESIPSAQVINNISDAYALMLYKIRTTYPNADVYCITSLEGRQTSGDTSYPILNSNNETIHEVNHTIAEIAHIFGAKTIDLQTCGIHYWNIADFTVDGTLHPNNAGSTVIAETIYNQLMNDYQYKG